MNARQKHPGTPTYHSRSARSGHTAVQRLPRYRSQVEIQMASYDAHFKTGFICGLIVGLAAMALVIWLWAVPTVEGATRDAASAVASAYGEVRA